MISPEHSEQTGSSGPHGDRAAPAGFFKAIRSSEALELISACPFAFVLLYVIAWRARRTDKFNRYNLAPGEALIGDHDECGMSEQEYKTAKKWLKKGGFATFRPTNKGTVATLSDTSVFDINIERVNGQTNRQPTDSQRTANEQPTTNKEREEGKEGEEAGSRAEARPALTDSEWFAELKAEPCYTGLDLDRERGLMESWCKVHHKQPTRRRFVNWINRADRQVEFKPTAEGVDPRGLPAQIFPTTGQKLIGAAMDEIKDLKADGANWELTLARETQESIVWLREHKPDGWEARVKEMEVNQKNYVRSQLKPEAQAKLRLLNKRVEEIKHAD